MFLLALEQGHDRKRTAGRGKRPDVALYQPGQRRRSNQDSSALVSQSEDARDSTNPVIEVSEEPVASDKTKPILCDAVKPDEKEEDTKPSKRSGFDAKRQSLTHSDKRQVK